MDEPVMRRKVGGRAAWLEPHEAMPADVDAWLRDSWGFDTSRGVDSYKDAQGWTWFVEKDPE